MFYLSLYLYLSISLSLSFLIIFPLFLPAHRNVYIVLFLFLYVFLSLCLFLLFFHELHIVFFPDNGPEPGGGGPLHSRHLVLKQYVSQEAVDLFTTVTSS